MDVWIAIARGPLLVFVFGLFALGLARQLLLASLELWNAHRLAGRRRLPFGALLGRTARWLVPLHATSAAGRVHAVLSVLLHAGVLIVPLFLAGHVALVRRAWGIGWPVLPSWAADSLTLVLVAAVAGLVGVRAAGGPARALSRPQDVLLLVLIGGVALTGYWVSHPASSLVPFAPAYLVHLLSAELLVVLVPFSKLSHLVVFPLTRVSTELGWHFVPGAGGRVRESLRKEGQPV